MDTLDAVFRLKEQLGDKLFAELIHSNNTFAVRGLALDFFRSRLPTEIKFDGVIYDILNPLKENERSIWDDVVVDRAKEMHVHLGKQDCDDFIKHRDGIPEAFCGVITFVFTDDCPADFDVPHVCCVLWDGIAWVKVWREVRSNWDGEYRFIRPRE